MTGRKPGYTTETLAEVIRRLYPSQSVPLIHSLPLAAGQSAVISGGFASGKTAILMDAAAQVILPGEPGLEGHGKQVIWIDLDGKFAISRFAQIVDAKLRHSSAVGRNSQVSISNSQPSSPPLVGPLKDALERFLYVKPTVASLKFLEILDQLETIDFEPRLIVIDSISAYLWLEGEEARKSGIFEKYALRLRRLTKKFGCSILMSFYTKFQNSIVSNALLDLATYDVRLSRSGEDSILARIGEATLEFEVDDAGISIKE